RSDPNRADLGHLDPPALLGRESKAVRPDYNAWLDHGARTYRHAVAQGHGADQLDVLIERHVVLDYASRPYIHSRPDHGTVTDDRQRADVRAGINPRSGRDDR